MLEYLRDMSGKPVAKILIAILTFSFVGWGVAEWILGSTGRETTLVKVGNREITVMEFNETRNREMGQLSRDEQKRVYTDKEYANNFMNGVMARMTNNAMVENRAEKLGFVITDKRIASQIRMFPEFMASGKFSPEKFDSVLANSGFSEQQFADDLRAQMLRSMVLGAISHPLPVPNFALGAMYNARYATRTIEYAAVSFSDFNVGNPTDSQLREFYAKNPKTNPETRAVSYAIIPANMTAPDSYDAGFAAAQKLEDRVISGETMSAAVSMVHKNAKFVSYPAFEIGRRPNDKVFTDSMISKIFSMDQGLESEIIEIPSGFLIVRVEKINPTATAEFDSVKNSLVSAWKKEEQKKQAYLRANDLLIKINAGGEIPNKKSIMVSRASGAPVDVLVSAFGTKPGTNTLVPASDAFYVLRVISAGMPVMDTVKMAAMRVELKNMTTRGIMDDYNSFLIRTYPVKINKKTFDKMFTK